mmetsp:Transcript_106140/g.317042  ORF Transcript_106140/g.317042 Transcript_106140/m.317042 type:complete len:294 (-) Transcript_106140:265-1146(-)
MSRDVKCGGSAAQRVAAPAAPMPLLWRSSSRSSVTAGSAAARAAAPRGPMALCWRPRAATGGPAARNEATSCMPSSPRPRSPATRTASALEARCSLFTTRRPARCRAEGVSAAGQPRMSSAVSVEFDASASRSLSTPAAVTLLPRRSTETRLVRDGSASAIAFAAPSPRPRPRRLHEVSAAWRAFPMRTPSRLASTASSAWFAARETSVSCDLLTASTTRSQTAADKSFRRRLRLCSLIARGRTSPMLAAPSSWMAHAARFRRANRGADTSAPAIADAPAGPNLLLLRLSSDR